MAYSDANADRRTNPAAQADASWGNGGARACSAKSSSAAFAGTPLPSSRGSKTQLATPKPAFGAKFGDETT